MWIVRGFMLALMWRLVARDVLSIGLAIALYIAFIILIDG